MKFKYNPEHVSYMKEQVFEAWEDLEVYSILSEWEYNQVKFFIDSPTKIMDLGCGLGRAGIYLNSKLEDDSIHFIMADATGDTENRGDWNEEAIYNNLELTKSFCEINNMKNFETFNIFEDDFDSLDDVDLIMSHCSVGVHFPIEDVMPKLLKIASNDCTMIFGLRRGLYSENSFEDLFDEVLFLDTLRPLDPRLPHQNWLILKDKKKLD